MTAKFSRNIGCKNCQGNNGETVENEERSCNKHK